jgi:hypothetical protein
MLRSSPRKRCRRRHVDTERSDEDTADEVYEEPEDAPELAAEPVQGRV